MGTTTTTAGLKSVLRFLFLIFLPFTAFSQQAEKYVITGSVIDSATNKPAEYSTITVFDESNTGVSSGYTTESGVYKITVNKPGKYKLAVTYIGYAGAETFVTMPAGKYLVQARTIYLHQSAGNLQEVTITGTRNLVEQKPGMLLYNAEADISNKGGSAADVLRKAPVINVDAQGNVTMRGSGNLKILVNGKYSGQMARSPADALNMMPASIIKSVEIVTTPSAKYDAEGAAGVINIITKKNQKDVSGALELGVSNLEQVLNPRFGMTNDKWALNVTAHLHRLRQKEESRLERQSGTGTDALLLEQDVASDNAAPHGSTDINVDYTIDSLSQLSFGINTWFGNWPGNNTIKNKLTAANGTVDEFSRDTRAGTSYLGSDFSIGYNKKFKNPGQEITLLGQFSPSKDNSRYRTVQFDNSNNANFNELNNSHTRNSEWTLQADYVQPLGSKRKYILEGGFKAIGRNVRNAYEVSTGNGISWDALLPDADRSDVFRYRQDVIAGYLLVKANLDNGWYAEAGTRLEGTYLEGKLANSNTNFTRRFTNLVPTATLSKKFSETQTLNISYTQRLTRPYIWDLSPNVNASDSLNQETGNPELQPEIAHQGEISYGITGDRFFVNTALYFRQTDNAIIDFMQTNPSGVSVTSKQNLAANKQYGLNLSASFKPNAKWNINSNINVNNLRFNSNALAIFEQGWAADFNLNATYKLPANYAVQAFGEYNTRQITLQGYETSRYYYSMAVKKEIPSKQLTLTLAAVNPFTKTINQSEIINGAGFTSASHTRYFQQSVKLTIGWEFGKLFESKERKKINNDDVKGMGKG